MDLQQLRYFVSVAEHLNFTKAAEVLYIGQSALSKQILNLEKYFGVQLFVRNKHSLRLTEAGDLLLNEAYEILAKVERTKHKVFQVASGSKGKLSIGYVGSIEKNLLPPIARNFRQHYPGLNMDISRKRSITMKNGLIRGDIDIGFVFEEVLEGNSELDWDIIFSGKMKAVFPSGHRLANKKSISVSELADESFIFPCREVFSHAHDNLVNMCKNSGFTPKIISCEATSDELLFMVESGLGITFLSNFSETITNKNVDFVSLKENYPVKIAIAWKKVNHNPAVPLFIGKVKEMLLNQEYKKYQIC